MTQGLSTVQTVRVFLDFAQP